MSYEQHCNDFAAFGDPEREHWDHEENARYDYAREAYGDMYDDCDDFCDRCDAEAEAEYVENFDPA